MKRIENLIPMLCMLLMGPFLWAQREAGIGHVTLLKKNGQAMTAATSGIGHVTLLKKNALLLYLGGGTENTGNSVKNAAGLTKLTSITEEIYKPLWVKRNFSLGLNAAGQYLLSNDDPLETIPEPYHINGETSSKVAVNRNGNPSTQGFRLGFGPQVNFHLGNHFVVSPIFDLGFMNITQKAYAVVQTSDVNATTYQYELLRHAEIKTSGMTMVPKLKLQYFFTKWLGIWAEASYVEGPTIKTVTNTFAPAGEPFVDTHDYELQALELGTHSETKTETKYSAVAINGGLVFAIGGGKHDSEPVETETTNYTGHVTLLKKNGVATAGIEKNMENHSHDKCVVIESPAFGSNNSKKENLIVKGTALEGVKKVSINLYKISDDEQLLRTADDQTRQRYFGEDYANAKTAALDTDAKAKKVISVDSEVKNNQVNQIIPKEKLSSGAYRLVLTGDNGCENTVTNFTVTSDDCDFTHSLSNVTDMCNGIFEQGGFKHKVTFTSNYKSGNCNLTFAQPGSGLKIYDDNMNVLSYTAVSGFPLQLQNQGSETSKSYSFDVIVPTSSRAIVIALQGDGCPNMAVHCLPGAQKKIEVKNCACQPCEQNNVTVAEVSAGTYHDIFRMANTIKATPNAITRIQADIVYISVTPKNPDCIKCNKKAVEQGNFFDMNHITQGNVTLWKDNGIGKMGGEQSDRNVGRSMIFTSNSASGVDLSGAGINITNTIGLPPASCCGDEVEIWVRYTVWDKNCHACDKLVKKKFVREASCEANATQGTNTNPK